MAGRGISGRLVAIVVLVVGGVLGIAGGWWMSTARPRGGAYLDVLAVGDGDAVAIRKEVTSERSVVELWRGGQLAWSALVPRYAAPVHGTGLAASPNVVTVRVVRNQHPQVWALAADDAKKIGVLQLAPDHPPSPDGYTLPVTTVSDPTMSFELVGSPGEFVDVVAIVLDEARVAWRARLPLRSVASAQLGERLTLWSDRGERVEVSRDGMVRLVP